MENKTNITSKQKFLLVSLLVITIILITTYYKYPWDFDHYTLGQYTYALIEKGYAPWVLNPISLFGYYPLSIPSGLEFFFSALNNLTNIDLPLLFYMFSIFSALFIVAGVYLVMREFSSFETSFITAFILATMVYFVKNVSNTGSSRIFNMMFYPLFILVLFKLYKIHKEENRLSIKHIFTAITLFVLMNLNHRFGQLSFIFIIAFVSAIIFAEFHNIASWLKSTKIYNIRKKSYEHSILVAYIDLILLIVLILSFNLIKNKIIWIVEVVLILLYFLLFDVILVKRRTEVSLIFDIILFMIYGAASKAVDLGQRGRLFINLIRLLEQYYFQLILLGILLVIAAILSVFLIIKKFKSITYFVSYIKNKIIVLIKKPEVVISWLLLLIMLSFITKNFTGDNFYTFGLEHYTESFLLKGNSPWIIMINFIINLNDNLTILIYFAFIGIIFLYLKNNKTFYNYFFIFVFMGFSQFLLDWEYIRLYMLPIYAILIGIGLTFVIRQLSLRFSRKMVYLFLIIIFLVHLVVGNVFIQREYFLSKSGLVETNNLIKENYFIELGNYLKDKGDISIHTSSLIEYDNKIGYYGKKVSAVAAQSVFTENKNFTIKQVPFNEILDSFSNGQKVTGFYNLIDPIFGGNYYFGRHIYNINKMSINDRNAQKVISIYNITYIVDSPDSNIKTQFFESVEPIQNKVYSSGKLDLYDLKEGQINNKDNGLTEGGNI